MKKAIFTFILALLAFTFNNKALATKPLSIRLNLGAAHYPLPAWTDFIGQLSNSEYKKDIVNPYGSLALYYDLSPKHSLFIGTEYLRTNAYLDAVFDDMVEHHTAWKFTATPLDLGYEFKLNPGRDGLRQLLTVGVSYFRSEVSGESYTVPEIFPPEKLKRTGNGYGFFGGIGLEKNYTQSLYTTVNFRARYADGMYFDDDPEDINVEFTSFDVNLGIGWRF